MSIAPIKWNAPPLACSAALLYELQLQNCSQITTFEIGMIDALHGEAAAIGKKIMHDIDDAIEAYEEAEKLQDQLKWLEFATSLLNIVAGLATMMAAIPLLFLCPPLGIAMLVMGAFMVAQGSMGVAKFCGADVPEVPDFALDPYIEKGTREFLEACGMSKEDAAFWAPIMDMIGTALIYLPMGVAEGLVTMIMLTPKIAGDAAAHVAEKEDADRKTVMILEMTINMLGQMFRAVALAGCGGAAEGMSNAARTVTLLANAIVAASQLASGAINIAQGVVGIDLAKQDYKAQRDLTRVDYLREWLGVLNSMMTAAEVQVQHTQNFEQTSVQTFMKLLQAAEAGAINASMTAV